MLLAGCVPLPQGAGGRESKERRERDERRVWVAPVMTRSHAQLCGVRYLTLREREIRFRACDESQ